MNRRVLEKKLKGPENNSNQDLMIIADKAETIIPSKISIAIVKSLMPRVENKEEVEK